MKNRTKTNERAGSDGSPVQRDVSFRILRGRKGDETRAGGTMNVGSNGVLFPTDRVLLPGRRVELSIRWPAKPNGKGGPKLLARGRIVGYERGVAAMEVLEYEFRTATAKAVAAAAGH